jgi:aspartate aminotransferase-like enzyme
MKPQDFHKFAAEIFSTPLMQMAAPTAAQAIANKVDELGALHAVIADLKKQAEHIRAELESAGLATIDGQHYTVNFAKCTARAVTDWRKIAERLNASRQLIAAYTTAGKPFTRLNITARKITH